MSVRIPLPYARHVVTGPAPDDHMVMFAMEEYDDVDNVLIIVSAMMSEAKWEALGRPSVTEIELGDE